MLSEACSNKVNMTTDDVIDSLTKIKALIDAAQWLTLTNEESVLHYDLIEAVQNIIRKNLNDYYGDVKFVND